MPSYIADFTIEFGEVGSNNWTTAPENLLGNVLQLTVEESLHLPAMFTLVIGNSYMPVSDDEKPWQFDSYFKFGQGIRIGFAPREVADDNTTSPSQQAEVLASQAEDAYLDAVPRTFDLVVLDPEDTQTTTSSNSSTSTSSSSSNLSRTYNYVIEGEVTAIEAHFNLQSQAPIVVRGYDLSHRLHRGRYNRSFQNMTDSDIVMKIATEVGIQVGTIETTDGPYGYNDISGVNGYVFQENQTNMEFMRERAARHGFELFVENSKLYFRKPAPGTTLSLTWRDDLLGFRVRVSSAEQVSAVEVRSWDYSRKQSIVSVKGSAQLITTTEHGAGNQTANIFDGKPASPRMIVVDQPVFGIEEADMIAQALYDELGGEFLYADARAEGNPLIRAGRVVKLEDMGKYTGQYYITETRHLYETNIYNTEFCVRGLRSGDLLSTVSPKQQLRPGQTFLVGIVTENRDPNGWGRVRVKFPTLSEDHNSYWARMVAMGAGASRGFDCLPEIGDEVLVAFEHGDIHRPYIIGGVWNGIDKPPESFAPKPNVVNSVISTGPNMGTVRLRTFKTRVGHQLQFAEEDPKDTSMTNVVANWALRDPGLLGFTPLNSFKGTHLSTAGGHALDMCDRDQAQVSCIQLRSAWMNGIKLNDSLLEPGITIKTTAFQTISLIDLPLHMPPLPQINVNTIGNVVINAGANPFQGACAAAQAAVTVGPIAARTPSTVTAALDVLTAKVVNPLSTVEITGGHINQFCLGGLSMITGPLSSAKVLPEQIYMTSPGVSISAVIDPLQVTIPTPGMLNLTATTLVNLLSPAAVTITAPTIILNGASIVLNGNVVINGSLTVNGPFTQDGMTRPWPF